MVIKFDRPEKLLKKKTETTDVYYSINVVVSVNLDATRRTSITPKACGVGSTQRSTVRTTRE